MSQSIIINSVNYDGEIANIIFTPDVDNVVINLGEQTLPFLFRPYLLTPPRDVYGVYTIIVMFNGVECPNILNVPRPTPTPTPTPTLTSTPTPTSTSTPTPTPTVTVNPCLLPLTPTPTNTSTVTSTLTSTPTPTITVNPCLVTPTSTSTSTPTPTLTNTPTLTSTSTPTQTLTLTNTPTNTPTLTPTVTPLYYYYNLLNCNLSFNSVGRSTEPLTGVTYNVDVNTCYTIVGIDLGPSYNYDLDTATLVTDCTDVLCGLPTPTPTLTNTPTNTPTPTLTNTPTPTDITSYLLQADGFYILQADGYKIIIT